MPKRGLVARIASNSTTDVPWSILPKRPRRPPTVRPVKSLRLTKKSTIRLRKRHPRSQTKSVSWVLSQKAFVVEPDLKRPKPTSLRPPLSPVRNVVLSRSKFRFLLLPLHSANLKFSPLFVLRLRPANFLVVHRLLLPPPFVTPTLQSFPANRRHLSELFRV
jgi:hypothetical protein